MNGCARCPSVVLCFFVFTAETFLLVAAQQGGLIAMPHKRSIRSKRKRTIRALQLGYAPSCGQKRAILVDPCVESATRLAAESLLLHRQHDRLLRTAHHNGRAATWEACAHGLISHEDASRAAQVHKTAGKLKHTISRMPWCDVEELEQKMPTDDPSVQQFDNSQTIGLDLEIQSTRNAPGVEQHVDSQPPSSKSSSPLVLCNLISPPAFRTGGASSWMHTRPELDVSSECSSSVSRDERALDHFGAAQVHLDNIILSNRCHELEEKLSKLSDFFTENLTKSMSRVSSLVGGLVENSSAEFRQLLLNHDRMIQSQLTELRMLFENRPVAPPRCDLDSCTPSCDEHMVSEEISIDDPPLKLQPYHTSMHDFRFLPESLYFRTGKGSPMDSYCTDEDLVALATCSLHGSRIAADLAYTSVLKSIAFPDLHAVLSKCCPNHEQLYQINEAAGEVPAGPCVAIGHRELKLLVLGVLADMLLKSPVDSATASCMNSSSVSLQVCLCMYCMTRLSLDVALRDKLLAFCCDAATNFPVSMYRMTFPFSDTALRAKPFHSLAPSL